LPNNGEAALPLSREGSLTEYEKGAVVYLERPLTWGVVVAEVVITGLW